MKVSRLLVFLFVANILLGVSQYALTFKRATDGSRLSALEKDLATTRQANIQAEVELYNLNSLARIARRAQELHLAKAQLDFVTINHEVALLFHQK